MMNRFTGTHATRFNKKDIKSRLVQSGAGTAGTLYFYGRIRTQYGD